jgi:hypothetical protein
LNSKSININKKKPVQRLQFTLILTTLPKTIQRTQRHCIIFHINNNLAQFIYDAKAQRNNNKKKKQESSGFAEML